jgi:RHS repeat-associated protein
VNQLFTGKERDAETGLDYFGERYFSAAQGRFTSPDALMAKNDWLVDPQRWNRYSYVRNNPLRYVDPNGEDLIIYTFYDKDLTEAQRKYLQANMATIQATIKGKFTKAGVNNVEFRDGSKLSQKQIAAIKADGTSKHLDQATGIGMLTFANKTFDGSAPPDSSTRGATVADNRSVVLLDPVNGGPNITDPDKLNFRVGEVAAHELGHSQAFEATGEVTNFVESLFFMGNLMGEGRGTPWMSKQFDRGGDKTQRAIREINRIGDRTPPGR